MDRRNSSLAAAGASWKVAMRSTIRFAMGISRGSSRGPRLVISRRASPVSRRGLASLCGRFGRLRPQASAALGLGLLGPVLRDRGWVTLPPAFHDQHEPVLVERGHLRHDPVRQVNRDLGVPPSSAPLSVLALEASRLSAPELWLELR